MQTEAVARVATFRNFDVRARGQIFTIDAGKYDVCNLTNSSGSAERGPA
jgi:hypothetical protein